MNRDWYEEHVADPIDMSDSWALLDDGQVIAEVEPISDAQANSDAVEWFKRHPLPRPSGVSYPHTSRPRPDDI